MCQIFNRVAYFASPRVHNRIMRTNDTRDRGGIVGGALTVALLITLAVQNAVPPMATDMYSAAFPQITADLVTNSTMLGFTLTTFFVGYATGQVLGGAISDQIGRRRPIIAGGIIALVGSMICVFTPNIWVLLFGRVFQGLGGGIASSVGRAFLVAGLTIAATGVVTLTISTFLLDLPLILTCVGFALIMTATAFIFGNSGAQAMSEAREHAGTASSVMGVFQSIANGIAAPLATSGGDSAVPMVLVMIVGSAGAWFAFWVIARGGTRTPRHLNLD